MKFLLYSALLLGLGATPILAQDAATPPQSLANASLQTDAARLLTADFVRSSICVGHGKLAERKTGDDVYLTFEFGNYTRLKGAEDTPFTGFLAPDAARAYIGKDVLVSARFDGAAKRGVITGIAPATEANVARVEELIAANPTLETHITASKTRYEVGEPIVMKWNFKNVSSAPLSISTGEHAVEFNLVYGDASHSWNDENALKRPHFVRLQPNESWESESSFAEGFSAGLVKIQYCYSAIDAFNDSRAAPDDLFPERINGSFEVEVVAASGERRARSLKRLESPVWTEQLEAAKLVLRSGNAADITQLESFATHPDPRLREVAAQAMVSKSVFTPALKRLFYEGTNIDLSALDTNDLTLAFLAYDETNFEAIESGVLGKSRGLPGTFYNVNDLRAGDLLASLLRDHDRYGYDLASLVGLRSEVGNRDEPLAPALKARLLEAWQAKRENVKDLFVPAQLQAEVALARSIRYNNFRKGPFYDDVVSILDDGQKFNFNLSATMDVIDQRILALPLEAVPTLFEVMRWRDIRSPPQSALERLADSDMPDEWERLAQVAYSGESGGNARVAAIELMAELDYKRALPHLDAWMNQAPVLYNWGDDAPRLAAAAVLGRFGDKRAVPVLLAPRTPGFATLDEKKSVAALQKATGLSFARMAEWSQWWDEQGSKMEWK